jgi:hypothetical protein
MELRSRIRLFREALTIINKNQNIRKRRCHLAIVKASLKRSKKIYILLSGFQINKTKPQYKYILRDITNELAKQYFKSSLKDVVMLLLRFEKKLPDPKS